MAWAVVLGSRAGVRCPCHSYFSFIQTHEGILCLSGILSFTVRVSLAQNSPAATGGRRYNWKEGRLGAELSTSTMTTRLKCRKNMSAAIEPSASMCPEYSWPPIETGPT